MTGGWPVRLARPAFRTAGSRRLSQRLDDRRVGVGHGVVGQADYRHPATAIHGRRRRSAERPSEGVKGDPEMAVGMVHRGQCRESEVVVTDTLSGEASRRRRRVFVRADAIAGKTPQTCEQTALGTSREEDVAAVP